MESELQLICSDCQGFHLDKYNIFNLGIIQKQTFLKIHQYHLYCVPYEISCKDCKLIVSLSPEELVLFKKYEDDLHKLHITIEDPETMEIVSIYINTKISLLGNMIQGNNYCFIDLFFKTVPESFTLLMKELCRKKLEYKELYNQANENNDLIESQYLDKITLDSYVSFRLTDQKKLHAKIVKISYSRMIIFLDTQNYELTNKTTLKIEFTKLQNSFFASGEIIHIKDSSEVKGFQFLTVHLDYSFNLIEILLPLYSHYNKILGYNSTEK